MTRLIEILISLAIVLALFLLVALVLPSSRHLSEKIETNRKMTIVYDTLNGVQRFNDWNPLVLRDPRMKLQLSGPDSGVGARLDYSSGQPALGEGSWEITATQPRESVSYAIVNPRRGHNKRSEFNLKSTGRGGRNVEITQTYDVDYGWDLLGRYAGLYVSRHVGDDIKLGLERLSNMLATVPNVDYRVQGSKLADLKTVDRPAQNLLVVSAGSIERNNQKIEDAMKADMEWIKRTMAANGLVATGPLRIISTELGRENYTFDVAQAVRRGSAADTNAGDQAVDGAASTATVTAPTTATVTASTTATAVASGDALTGLKLQGPVQYVRTEAGRAATASYTGYMAELENVRNAVRAWTVTQGYEPVGRPYEVYNNGIEQAFTENGQFQVYWDLKP